MTAHYAKITDQTVRRRWEQATKVNVKGERVSIDPDGPLAQAQWAKTRYGIATQTLPHGYCGLPVQKSCPHANACLTCPVFLTGPEFLPELREHRAPHPHPDRRVEAHRTRRVVEMNNQVLTNLDRMIGEVEKTATRRTPPMPADNSRHLVAAARRRAEQPDTAPSPRCAAWTPPAAVTFDGLAREGRVSRSWLYNQPDLRAEIERLRARRTPRRRATAVPDRQRASDASLLQRLESATERIRRLEDDNRQLRDALARRPRRTPRPRHPRPPRRHAEKEIQSDHGTLLTTASTSLATKHPCRSTGPSNQRAEDNVRLPATFIYAGVEVEAQGLFAGARGRQIAGRFTVVAAVPFAYGTAEQRASWHALVAAVESTLRLRDHVAGTLPEMAEQLYRRSRGMIGSLSQLVRGAAILAIDDGTEKITAELLDLVPVDYAAQRCDNPIRASRLVGDTTAL